ncbi:PRC-barrel domain-containing protein [Paenibacillus sp. 481]|uniref:PRC-barrel domain-containing protein n=1 Tax=Paenibacillus sp. 481 TaxID=2835869 RepID=UPI001E30DB2E|nr:PRC-barrel domain-containing protein [Paenibacillus sp. 481]UHA74306.1 PRC-barrel domain-containing protein [Paenibacillus sp. 481]
MKLLELIGLPVYDIVTGKRVSKVKDIWLSEQHCITHIELEGVSRFERVIRYVAWEDVTGCGEDAIMIVDNEAVQHSAEVFHERKFLHGGQHLKDLPVVTTEGIQVGWVADVYFQPNMGNQLISLEITDGLLSDLLEGRRRIDWTSQMTWGEDAIVVQEG